MGLVLLFVIVQGSAFGALHAAGGSIDVHGVLGIDDALQLAAIQLAGIAAAVVLVLAGVGSWRRIGVRAPRGAASRGLRALLPLGLLVIAPAAVVVVVTGGELVHPSVGAADVLAYTLLALCVSVNEELWFRGLVFDVLGGAERPWRVVLVSSLLFGLPHYAGGAAALLNTLAVTLAVGVPFALVRLRYPSLVPLVAWHAIIDTWAFLHTASAVPIGNPSTAELAAGLVVPAGVAAGYVAWFRRRPALHDAG